ncbi:MAG: hypothetical protein ABL982_05680 [Vicinamibacterales bacterium]
MHSRTQGMPVSPGTLLLVTVLLTALLHGAVLLRVWPDPARFMDQPDSTEYVTLASNLLDGHGFTLSTRPPYEPDVRRTPVYPAVLAAVFAVAGRSPRTGALANLAIWCATLVVIALGLRRWGTRAAVWACAWLAVDITSLVYHHLVLTETLFALLVSGVVSVLALRPRRRSTVLLAGVLLGAATLCRPIAVLLGPALLPWFGWRVWRDGLEPRAALRDYVVLNVVNGVIVLAWVARNLAMAGVMTLSVVGGVNMYLHRAAHVQAALTGRDVDLVRADLERVFESQTAGMSRRDKVRWLEQHGMAVVSAHPAAYVASSTVALREMLSPDRQAVFRLLAIDAGSASGGVLLVTAWLQLLLFYAAVIAGAGVAWRVLEARSMVVLVAVVCAYFMLIGGPEMYARFRVPLMPPLALIAGFAFGPGVRRDS